MNIVRWVRNWICLGREREDLVVFFFQGNSKLKKKKKKAAAKRNNLIWDH